MKRTLTLLVMFALAFARAQAEPVRGYVDLHSHLMAEHAFGGSWYWGTVEGGMDWAVRRCDGNFPGKSHAAMEIPVLAELVAAPGVKESIFDGDTGWHLGKRRGYDRRQCRYALGVKVPGTCPREHFEDWPMWNSMAHQQMWQGWLQQAHQRGLQVLVVSAAESNFLCQGTAAHRYGCDELESARRQVMAARGFAERNSSWVGLATTPAEARALIAKGKLALVMAVEITQLFPTGNFLAQLDALRAIGVRSVQVVHHANNRFAGAAPIASLIESAKLMEKVKNRDITDIDETTCRDAAGRSGDCDGDVHLNQIGLTADGHALVNGMMSRGMIVDVAHLSREALRQTFEIARARGNYPLLYSHTHMWDTITDEDKHEKYLLESEIPMITTTGGMVGLRTGPEYTHAYAPSVVADTCGGSSRSFAQSLMYAVDRGLSVGFGADLNGFIRQLRPRYSDGCPADRRQIDLAGGPNEFQKKGLAHIGLLPSLMDDLTAVGVPARYLDHLNQSAERFLQMWERSRSGQTLADPPLDYAPPYAACSATPGSGVKPVTVTFSGTQSTASRGARITSYRWVFSDEPDQPYYGETQMRTFTTARTYRGTLTVTDNLGGSSSTSCLVAVTGWGSEAPINCGGEGQPICAPPPEQP